MREESGRSLVEMMGTLAIMGILAIAGIWMYNSAIDKLKANTIINEAQKRAVVVAGQIGFQGRTDPSLEEFTENEFAGGTFSTGVVTSGLYEQFGIQVSGVSKNVCQNILNSIGEGSSLRRLTGVTTPRTALATCAENNTLLMIYNNDMADSSGDTSYTCEKDSDCSACGTCNTETHACENECVLPEVPGGCDFDNECNADNKCMVCNEATHLCEDGCKRVEYLEGNGNQWIDTEIVLPSTAHITVKWSVNGSLADYNFLFGSRTSTSSTDRCEMLFKATKMGYDFAGTTSRDHTAINTNGNMNTSEISYEGNVLKFFKNNGTNGTSTNSVRTACPYSLYIFDTNTANTTTGFKGKYKLYSFKIDGICDFIPVHAPFKTDGKQNCLFDRMSGDLFCNKGTDDFKTNLD